MAARPMNPLPPVDPQAELRLGVRARIAQMQQGLGSAGHRFRPPPPEPTTCCGRGCQGCVWEGYEAALAWWFEQAQQVTVHTTRIDPNPTGIAP